jgi:quinol-cytochrome oxidoreductase complex cytochrome b subunit
MSTQRSVRKSFFLHIHPERVREHTLAPATTLGLGVLAIALLGILMLSGVALMFWYVPAPGLAYDHLVDLRAGAHPVGGLLRDVHRFASDALVVVCVLHLARVYLTGALGRGQRLNWLVGLGLLLATTATAFTGFLLPWDAEAYWAATVGGELAALFPFVGRSLQHLLWGGETVGAATVLRAYALHVAALPLIGTLLLGYHLWRIRRAGGLARPHSPDAEAAPGALVPTRPALTTRELIITLSAITALLVAALFWDAPLGLPGHPPRTLDPAKAPWFLLWVQELVSYAAWLGAAVPTLLFALLALAPLREQDQRLAGVWLPRGRRLRCAVFLVTLVVIVALLLVAEYLRGPGWRLLL